MRDFDPRDYLWQDRDDRRPEPGRAGHSSASPGARDRAASDPRDVAVRHVDLPNGPTREPIRVRDRDYAINGSQSRMLATVGAFRVVSARDLEANRDHDHPRVGDLHHLRGAGLVEMVRQPGHQDRIVTLTEQGRELLEAHRRPDEDGTRQAFYAGVRKPRELEHDVRVYRAYQQAAERLAGRGNRIRRVTLDYELKREYQQFLQERNRGRADSNGRPDREADEIAAWAREHDLPYFEEQVHFPDVRIEYEDIDGRTREEDVEVTTAHYRGAHAAAAARSGFSQYRGISARVSAGHGGGGGRGGGRDPRIAEELL